MEFTFPTYNQGIKFDGWFYSMQTLVGLFYAKVMSSFLQAVLWFLVTNNNAHKTEYMCYNQTGDITTLDGTPLKLVDKFTYLGSSVSSTEKDIDTRLTKAWTAIDKLSIIWKSDLTDKMKRSFFQAAVVSILLYECTTWTLTKRLEKKIDGHYTRMLRAILNKSWRQNPTRHQLYGHLPPITKTIQVRRTRHTRHCWRSRDELISDVLLWTPTYGRAKAGRPALTYSSPVRIRNVALKTSQRRGAIGRSGEGNISSLYTYVYRTYNEKGDIRGTFNKFPDFFCTGI